VIGWISIRMFYRGLRVKRAGPGRGGTHLHVPHLQRAPRVARAARFRREGTPVFNSPPWRRFWCGSAEWLSLSRYYAVWYVVALGVAVLSGWERRRWLLVSGEGADGA